MNGLRKWLIGLATAFLVTWTGWVSASIIQAGADRARMETKLDSHGELFDKEVLRRLDSMEKKIDQLTLERR
jgi:hypothetical protein